MSDENPVYLAAAMREEIRAIMRGDVPVDGTPASGSAWPAEMIGEIIEWSEAGCPIAALGEAGDEPGDGTRSPAQLVECRRGTRLSAAQRKLQARLAHEAATGEPPSPAINLINQTLAGRISMSPPTRISQTIGWWLNAAEDLVDAETRHSAEWRELLVLAIATTPELDDERLQTALEWIWNSVMPALSRIAEDAGIGDEWSVMNTRRTLQAAINASAAAGRAGDRLPATSQSYRLISAAGTAAQHMAETLQPDARRHGLLEHATEAMFSASQAISIFNRDGRRKIGSQSTRRQRRTRCAGWWHKRRSRKRRQHERDGGPSRQTIRVPLQD